MVFDSLHEVCYLSNKLKLRLVESFNISYFQIEHPNIISHFLSVQLEVKSLYQLLIVMYF